MAIRTTAKAREADRQVADMVATLCRRDLQLALLAAEGLTYEESGTRLHLGTETVRSYMTRLRSRLGLNRKPQIAAWAATHREQLIKRLEHVTASV